MRQVQVTRRTNAPVLLAVLSIACTSLIAPYNETAYENATSLKAEALALMSKATECYSNHEERVEALLVSVEQAYEFVKGIAENGESTRQWEIIKDPEGNMLGGFMKRWKKAGQLGETFVENAKDDLVGPAFDKVIRLEALKIRE